jgi:uncharacterized protein (TIGR00369 family)
MTSMLDPAHEGWKPRTPPGFIGLVGPLWTKRQGASWSYGILAEEKHTNPAGIVHGGLLTTLLDHALSTIAWEANERSSCITVALDVHFLAAARPGDLIAASGRIVRQTSSLIFMPIWRASVAICARMPKSTLQRYPTAEDLMNAKRSALIVSASVVGMPCGKPL